MATDKQKEIEKQKFLKRLRNLSILVAAICTTIITAPVALPALLVKIAGYLAVISGISSAVSEAITDNQKM